eukprot:Lankesteria_metandrocarpae@DN10424_c0_g1_i1.p1
MGAGYSPSIFAKIIDSCFGNLYELGVIAYFDNIVVATTDDRKSHLKIVEKVLQRMKELKLIIKFAKGTYATKALEILCWKVDGVVKKPNDAIKTVIASMTEVPTTNKMAISSIATLNHVATTIPGFPQRVKVWRDKIASDEKWKVSPQEAAEWQSMARDCIRRPPVYLYDSTKMSRVTTDWSNYAMGAVFQQKQQNELWGLVACLYRKCNMSESRYSSYKGELC